TAEMPATPDSTAAPATTAAPTTTKATAPSTTKTKGKTSTAPRTTMSTVPILPTPSASDLVLAYYEASNARGRCVAHQPPRATADQVIAACGAEPVPPGNLLQYWTARDAWNACADPFYEKE